jgi:hypothetical protein
MSKAETETSILYNAADLDEGFFRLGTSQEHIYNKVLKRVGQINIIDCQIRTQEGKPVWWDLKINAKCFSKSSLGLKYSNPDRPKKKFNISIVK